LLLVGSSWLRYGEQQVLGSHIQTIASTYTGNLSGIYQRAADQWRQPYWDWALDGDLPTLFRQQNVTVTSANGKVTLPNPPLLYKFQQYPLNATLFPSTTLDGLLNTYPETVRCPGYNSSASNQYQASDGVGAYNLPLQLVSHLGPSSSAPDHLGQLTAR
jgi:tyrosinase